MGIPKETNLRVGEKMVKTLTMKCPHCNQIAEVFLSTNAYVIVLNCPACYSPIMYFEQKIFLLSKNQMEAIKGSTKNTTIMKILDKIANSEAQRVPVVTKGFAEASSPVKVFHHNTLYDRYISDDDIINLRIDLGLCNDSLEFIMRL